MIKTVLHRVVVKGIAPAVEKCLTPARMMMVLLPSSESRRRKNKSTSGVEMGSEGGQCRSMHAEMAKTHANRYSYRACDR